MGSPTPGRSALPTRLSRAGLHDSGQAGTWPVAKQLRVLSVSLTWEGGAAVAALQVRTRSEGRDCPVTGAQGPGRN